MQPASRSDDDRRRIVILAISAGAVVLVVVAFVVAYFWVFDSDDASPATTVPSGAVVLPQNPSLRLLEENDTWFVENDGNVTMSEIVVRDGPDSVICDLGTLSPDDRASCDAAGEADDLSVFGLGPQGQVVDVGAG